MSDVEHPRLLWVERLPPPPLCDVPWFGTSIVMSDGSVNFCCHSNGVAGNINTARFEDIWNGDVMREIRRDLAAQRLPVLCQTSSCPFFRGDARHFLIERTGRVTPGSVSIGDDYRPLVHTWMRGTSLRLRRRRRLFGADRLDIELEVRYSGPHAFAANLLVGMASDAGPVLFAPTLGAEPWPLRHGIPMSPAANHHHVREPSLPMPRGTTEVCVALMLASGNPLRVNQCVWSEVASI